VVEGDAGAGESVLDVVWDAAGVSVGGDGDGAEVAGGGEGRTHVLGDEVGVAAAGDLAVLDVPPHRSLHRCVLPHSRRRRPPGFAGGEGGWGVFYGLRRRRRRRRGGLKEGIVLLCLKKRYKFAARWRSCRI
jgi:hypothetical protein